MLFIWLNLVCVYIYIYIQFFTYKIYVVKPGLFNNLVSQNIIYKLGLYEYNAGLKLGIKCWSEHMWKSMAYVGR